MVETTLWQALEEQLNHIFHTINGKQVILWGYGQSGLFLEHVFRRKNRNLDYIIDDYKEYSSSKAHIYKTSILQELDNKNCFILCAFPEDDESRRILSENGYKEHVSYIYLSKAVYGEEEEYRRVSYYDWLEYYYGVDISALEHVESGDNLCYSCGNGYFLMDVLDNFVFTKEDSFFDFGCGKGGPMIMCYDKGIGHVGGVEFDKRLCDIAKNNFEKCGVIDYELFNDNALNIKAELDHYNFFYMYNPFKRDTFRGVIKNLEDSYLRNKRKMFLLYSGVTHHADVVRNRYFRLAKRINSDCWNKYTNVYLIDG